MIADTNEKKRPRGRPSRPAPEPIQDTPENIIKTVVRTRSRAERDRILKNGRSVIQAEDGVIEVAEAGGSGLEPQR